MAAGMVSLSHYMGYLAAQDGDMRLVEPVSVYQHVETGELRIEDNSILDSAQRQLVVDGRRVDLTKLEFDVISYLQQHQGHVVERAALLRDVWGYEYAGGSNVIEANVRSLRRKLGDHAGSIETVRGLGYRFSVPVRSEADAPAHSMTSS